MAGPADAAILVGFVHRNGLDNKWQAQTPAMIAISGGPWRTRQGALIHLVLHHQLTGQLIEQTPTALRAAGA
jgi:hypothetical protein